MALHPHNLGRASALPLSALLAAIPSLPRPILSRLTARMVERLDEMDGDCDLEMDDFAEDDNPTEESEPGERGGYGMPGWAARGLL